MTSFLSRLNLSTDLAWNLPALAVFAILFIDSTAVRLLIGVPLLIYYTCFMCDRYVPISAGCARRPRPFDKEEEAFMNASSYFDYGLTLLLNAGKKRRVSSLQYLKRKIEQMEED